MDVTPIKIEEIRMSIRRIKSGEAAGLNNIPAEALKSDIEVTANTLHTLFKKIWRKNKCRWTGKKDTSRYQRKEVRANVRTTEASHYCQHLSVPGKVFNRVLLNRMKDAVDAQFRDQRAGFR
ncbi:unnamed protein product, partial [Schistosoma mattheei]